MANAKKENPVAMPAAKAHHASNVSLAPDAAALAITVASATAVVIVQRALTGKNAHAVKVHQPSVRRDPEVSTTSPVSAYRDKAAAATQWTAVHRMTLPAIRFI